MSGGERDRVVLLHGLGRTSISLTVPSLRLRVAGFRPVNIGYRSRSSSVEELTAQVAERLPEPDGSRLHFLTHSLGGILVRHLAQSHRPPDLGRVVMLSPPNRGSGLASRLRHTALYRTVLGPAAQQLGAEPNSLPNRLGPVDFELGVITGNRGAGPAGLLLSRESDGVVAVDEAGVEGMKDFLVVRRGHTMIMNDAAVLEQAVHFFREGCFRHPEASP